MQEGAGHKVGGRQQRQLPRDVPPRAALEGAGARAAEGLHIVAVLLVAVGCWVVVVVVREGQ